MEDVQIESQENELASRTSCLLHLYKKRSCLQQILRQYQMKVMSARDVITEPLTADVDVLKGRIGDLNKKLIDISEKKLIRDTFIKLLQFSDTLTKELFPQEPSIHTSAVKTSVSAVNELVSTVLRILQELITLHHTVVQLSDSNRELMQQCHELAVTIQHQKEQRERQQQHSDDPAVARVHQEINHLIDKLHIEQNCQLGLIHGSQIDWYSDPELCTRICELGQPVAQRLD